MNGRKKKIAHVLKSSIYSGAENVVLTIMKGLREEYDFLYIATEGPIRKKLEEEQVPFWLLEQFNYRNLAETVQKYKPDIVHAHDFSATVLCALIPGKFGLISHLHYDPPWARSWNVRTVAYSLLGRKVSRILAVSSGAYNNFVFADILKNKTVIMDNPIDKNNILAMGGPERNKTYDVLFVGRLVEQKDPQTFIEIINRLKKKKKEIRSAMVGTGVLEHDCRKLIERYGLQKNIELLGFQKNPYFYMKAARLLCMTSKWEGYGLVAAEANILGTPVLSTKTGGVKDVLGIDVEELCDGIDDFAEKIWMLLNDCQEYQRWQKKAYMRAENFVTPKSYMKKLDLIYKEGMESR